jgi:hypothetical protein
MEQLQSLPIALKEWAVSVKALAEGKQIIVMRKGGIVEETRDFQLVAPSFYLMPAYEHQKQHLLKEAAWPDLDATLAGWTAGIEELTIEAYAEAVEDIEITDQTTLDKLREFHIWTDEFAEERLRWKKTKPLHVLVLRVYRLKEPVKLSMLPAYNGCKSWVQLEKVEAAPEMTPVIEEETFQQQWAAIRQALAK